MFWRAKSPLDADDEEWQLAAWDWLSSHFGGAEALRARRLVLPNAEFFTRPKATGHAAAQDLFDQTARQFAVDPAQFRLVPQANAVDEGSGPFRLVREGRGDPAGTFSVTQGGTLKITYKPELVAHPMQLVATFAHEICHPLLMATGTLPPGGAEMEEFATDLAVTFFGFGIFNANTAAIFRQFNDTATGTQGWSMDRQGYLSPAERAFALALFVFGREDDQRDVRRFLDQGPLAYFGKAARYLAANPGIASRPIASCGEKA